MRAVLFALIAFLPAVQGTESIQPQRIVSTAGTLTEIVWALGAGDRLVAVDSSSVYPEQATNLPQVGYSRQLSAEGIFSVRPDLVLLSEDAGPPAVLEQLERLGVPLITISADHSVEAALERIHIVGRALGRKKEAEELAQKVESEIAQVSRKNPRETAPKVLFLYARSGGIMNVAGRNTAADIVISMAGGVNAINGYEGYKPLTAEAAVTAAPDVILVTDRGMDASGGAEELLKQPGLSMTPAGRNRRIVAMDDLLLLGFGPRLGEAVGELSNQLQPVLARTDRP